jgi:hypothetical protein
MSYEEALLELEAERQDIDNIVAIEQARACSTLSTTQIANDPNFDSQRVQVTLNITLYHIYKIRDIYHIKSFTHNHITYYHHHILIIF